jgi:hypothetical protein
VACSGGAIDAIARRHQGRAGLSLSKIVVIIDVDDDVVIVIIDDDVIVVFLRLEARLFEHVVVVVVGGIKLIPLVVVAAVVVGHCGRRRGGRGRCGGGGGCLFKQLAVAQKIAILLAVADQIDDRRVDTLRAGGADVLRQAHDDAVDGGEQLVLALDHAPRRHVRIAIQSHWSDSRASHTAANAPRRRRRGRRAARRHHDHIVVVVVVNGGHDVIDAKVRAAAAARRRARWHRRCRRRRACCRRCRCRGNVAVVKRIEHCGELIERGGGKRNKTCEEKLVVRAQARQNFVCVVKLKTQN